MWKRFQPGEGPSRGLLRDYVPSDGPFQALLSAWPRHRGRGQECHLGHPGRQPAGGGRTAAQAGNCRPSRATLTVFASYQENRYSNGKKIKRQVWAQLLITLYLWPRWLNVGHNGQKQTKNIVLQHFILKEMNKQYKHMIDINQIIYLLSHQNFLPWTFNV